MWDVRSGTCLLLRTDHHADVYGLACHPARPFLLASCSRDTTLRLWSTLPLTPHLLPQVSTREDPIQRNTSACAVGFLLTGWRQGSCAP